MASDGYSMLDHGAVSTGGRGNYVLKPGARAQLWRPSWKRTVTTFRPLPGLDNNGQLRPFAVYSETHAAWTVGDWIRSYPMFRGGTRDNPLSFMICDPTQVHNFKEVVSNCPSSVLHRAIERACERQAGMPHWADMLKGQNGPPPLAPAEMGYLMQGLMYQHNSEFKMPARGVNDDVVVLNVSGGGVKGGGGGLGRKLVQNAMAIKQGVPPELIAGQLQENSFAWGDWVSPDAGRFLRFCEANGELYTKSIQQGFSVAPQQGQMAAKGFDINIETHLGQMGASMAGYEEWIRQKVQPWWNILNFPCLEEQAELVAKSFPADMVEVAFREHPQYLTAEVRGILSGKIVAMVNPSVYPNAVPGYPQQPGYPAQPGYPPQVAQGFPQMPMQPAYPQPGLMQPGFSQQPGFPQQPAYPQAPQMPGYQPLPGLPGTQQMGPGGFPGGPGGFPGAPAPGGFPGGPAPGGFPGGPAPGGFPGGPGGFPGGPGGFQAPAPGGFPGGPGGFPGGPGGFPPQQPQGFPGGPGGLPQSLQPPGPPPAYMQPPTPGFAPGAPAPAPNQTQMSAPPPWAGQANAQPGPGGAPLPGQMPQNPWGGAQFPNPGAPPQQFGGPMPGQSVDMPPVHQMPPVGQQLQGAPQQGVPSPVAAAQQAAMNQVGALLSQSGMPTQPIPGQPG